MINEENINITPKSDVIFKNIFGNEKNKKILEGLLEAILNKKVDIESVQKSKELDANNINDKVGILDVQAILSDGIIVNIEMQSKIYPEYHKRIMYYLGKLITDQINKGEEYSKIKDIILINIVGYKIPWCKEFYSKYEIQTIKKDNQKINGVTIYFLQIPRFEKERKLLKKNVRYEDIVKTELDKWLVYFSYKNKEVLDMVKVKNMDIEEAVRLYEELKERKEVVHLYNSRLMEEMDNKARLNYAVRKATEATEKRVRKETEKATLDQVIRKLLSEKVSKDIILKVTGISEEKLNSFILDNNT